MCWTHESDEIIKDTLNRINVTLTTLKNIYLLKLHIFATIPRFAQLFKLVFCNELPPDISEEDENYTVITAKNKYVLTCCTIYFLDFPVALGCILLSNFTGFDNSNFLFQCNKKNWAYFYLQFTKTISFLVFSKLRHYLKLRLDMKCSVLPVSWKNCDQTLNLKTADNFYVSFVRIYK